MFKQLLTLAAVTVAAVAPAVASTPHDFDPSNVSVARSLDGQCYNTTDGSKVCFMRLKGETFSVAVKDSDKPEYPQVMLVDCTSNKYKGFGPLADAEVNAMATAFCRSGRY